MGQLDTTARERAGLLKKDAGVNGWRIVWADQIHDVLLGTISYAARRRGRAAGKAAAEADGVESGGDEFLMGVVWQWLVANVDPAVTYAEVENRLMIYGDVVDLLDVDDVAAPTEQDLDPKD